MAINYNKTEWKAGKEGGTAWTPDRLNNIENGIEQTTNAVNQLNNDVVSINSNLTNITNNLSNVNIKFGYGTSVTFVTKKSRAFLVLAIENGSNNVFVGRTKVASNAYYLHSQIHGSASFSFTDNGNGTCTVAYTGTATISFGWLVIS